MKRALVILAVTALTLLGCSAPEEGVVVGKRYTPASTWTSYDCITYNTKGFCSLRLPRQHTTPESWCLVLRHGEDEGCRAVDQVTYHKYERGMEYP